MFIVICLLQILFFYLPMVLYLKDKVLSEMPYKMASLVHISVSRVQCFAFAHWKHLAKVCLMNIQNVATGNGLTAPFCRVLTFLFFLSAEQCFIFAHWKLIVKASMFNEDAKWRFRKEPNGSAPFYRVLIFLSAEGSVFNISVSRP